MTRIATALLAGVLLFAGLVVSSPRTVDIDIGGLEPATLTGVYAGEEHYGRRIRWTEGRARVEWPGALGVTPTGLEVELASFFGRAGDQVMLTTGVPPLTRHTLTGEWDVVGVPIAADDTRVALDLQSDVHAPPGDPRRLGVRLDRVSVANGSLTQILSTMVWWHALVVVLVGAVLSRAGLWLSEDGRQRPGPMRTQLATSLGVLAVAGAALWWWRLWLLQPAGIRVLAGAVVFGVTLAMVLRRGDRAPRRLAAATALACGATWIVMATWSLAFFVDVPRWDIWDSVRLIEKHYAGTLTPADFWGAHNEHRPLTARLVIFASLWLTQWNHWAELGVSLALSAFQLLLIVVFVGRSQTHRLPVHPLSLVVIGLMIFSATQWENWLRGYHVHIVMGAVATMAALLVLCVGRPTFARLAGAMALGVLGELSFGSGLIVWPLGALAIAGRRGDGWPARLAAWCVVSAVAIALYFPGLPHRPGLSEVSVASPFEAVRVAVGTLVSIAMPIIYIPDVFAGPTDLRQALVVAVASVAVCLALVLIVVRWRQDALGEYTWLFPALLVAFGLGSGALAAMGRASMGLYALTASRYIVYAGCFWVGLLLLLAMRPSTARPSWTRATTAVLLMCALALGASWFGALPYMDNDAALGRRARADLLRGDAGTAAAVLYPDGPELARMADVLRRHQLSVFRPGAR